MNMNLLIESIMIITIIVFLISMLLLTYYSVKAKGLVKPVWPKRQNSIHNNRLRDKSETIFDSVVSESPDFIKYPGGQAIFEVIRNFK